MQIESEQILLKVKHFNISLAYRDMFEDFLIFANLNLESTS